MEYFFCGKILQRMYGATSTFATQKFVAFESLCLLQYYMQKSENFRKL